MTPTRNSGKLSNSKLIVIRFGLLSKTAEKNKYEIILGLLVLTSFTLRLLISHKEPFLHDWDERFHALVARNLMHHPLQPMLRLNPVNEYDRFSWCCNHIWLHKQPLFMWQMAASMKIFGVSELSMRLPSIIMGTVMTVLLYRVSYLLTRNKMIALLAATFLCFSHFHLEMISGIKGMDHNDVALGFYVLGSLWAYAEYMQSNKWYWAVLVGVFSGCAILNKWLLGLFVFLCWGIILLMNARTLSLKQMADFLLALFVCCCVFIPWQLYILHNWPVEARYEYEFNRRHITEVLEGHSGTIWFHWDRLSKFFSPLWPVFFLGLIFTFSDSRKLKSVLFSFFAGLIFVFCFFSFIVKTKVESHFFFVAPLFILFMSIGIGKILQLVSRWVITVPAFLLVAFLSLKPQEFDRYFRRDPDRKRKIHNTVVYKNLREILPEEYKIVMNLPSFEDVELMFYHNDITAYHWCLNEKDLKKLADKKIPIAVFKSHGQYTLPDYIMDYPHLFIINEELQ